MPDLFDVQVKGAEDFARVSRDLRKAGRGDLRKQMNKQIRAEARPTVAALKSAVLSVETEVPGAKRPARGARSTNLRVRIARAIQVKLTTSGWRSGVRIRVDGTKLGEQRALPKALDSPRGWKHPVFGDRNVWVAQRGEPWWGVTIEPRVPGMRRRMQDVIERVARQIAS